MDNPAPETLGTPAPTVFAEGGSVVTNRKIQDVKANTLNMKIEIESDHRGAVGPAPKADYSACDKSVICADTMSGVTVDNIDFSICVKQPKVHAEQVQKTPQPPASSSQGRGVEFITGHKVELINCLRADPSFILQRVHALKLITQGQYLKIKNISDPETAAVNIIDQVINNGQKYCSRFLELLKKTEVLETYPELQEIPDL